MRLILSARTRSRTHAAQKNPAANNPSGATDGREIS